MQIPDSPSVLLLVSQAGVGKTKHFSEKLAKENSFAVCHPETDYKLDTETQFPVFIDRWIDESVLESECKARSFNYILFLSLSVWDENEARHLEIFIKLAHLASSLRVNIFGEINLSSVAESSLFHVAVKNLMLACKNIHVEMRELEKGSAVEISFEAKEILKKFPKS